MASTTGKHSVYRFGVFEADAVTGQLQKKGERVKLQEQPFRLLCLLLENVGETVSREEVRERLWPGNTFVEFDASLSVAVGKLRDALGDDSDNPRFIETVPRKGYRFIAPAHAGPGAVFGTNSDLDTRAPSQSGTGNPRILLLACLAGLIITAGVAGWYWRGSSNVKLAEKASVVVGDFANTTGDEVFDGSLQRATVIELAQSPYLSVIPDATIADALQDLGRPPDEKLTPAMLRQVCQRESAAAAVDGAIQKSADAYLLSVEAVRCSDGSTLTRESVKAPSKDKVLAALDTAIQNLRRKLGESRESLKKYDAEVEQATTSSLEALKAYQLGLDLRSKARNMDAIPAFKTAITLDPNFAIAYAQLGSSYSNMGDTQEGSRYFRKAYELRARATEPERLYIVGRYYDIVTGELEKASEVYKLGTEMYPKDWRAYNSLANDANQMGRYDTVIEASKRAILLAPNHSFGYGNLLTGLIASNRFDEAKAVNAQIIEKGLDDSLTHFSMYAIAFAEHDAAGMEREVRWAEAHSNDSGVAFVEAEAAAAQGKLRESTERFRKIAAQAVASKDPESAGNVLAVSSELNSEVGSTRIALQLSETALKLVRIEATLGLAALVNARAGQGARAQELLDKLDHDYPLMVFNMGEFGPMARSALAVSKGTTREQVAGLMEPALPYELGQSPALLPVYVRASGFLKTGAGEEAAREFQKILHHRGVDPVSPLQPLSYLGLGRAYALMGKTTESHDAYLQFFALWKEADPDLPILLEAKKEYKDLSRKIVASSH